MLRLNAGPSLSVSLRRLLLGHNIAPPTQIHLLHLTSCSHLFLARQNRIPSCPLCSAPITFKPGTDPNIPMDAHLSTACPILHPSLAKKKAPKPANVCASKGCKTKMIVPIRCTACGRNHCPQHRFEKDHACAGKPAPAVTGAGGRGKGATPQAGTGKTSLSGLAALRRAQTKVAAKITPSTPANTVIIISDSEPSSDSDIEIISPRPAAGKTANTDNKGVKALASVGVGRKVDKRALAEQESQRRGLEARAKKG